MKELTQDRLKELLIYYPKTGNFRWKINRPGKHARKGNIAGSHHIKGYIQIFVDGISYKAHRLAFLYMMGQWPKDQVDHINGERYNNKWINLRDVNQSTNSYNQHEPTLYNKSGFLGVSYVLNNIYHPYRATLAGKHIGYFPTPELAHQAYLKAKEEING